MNSRNSLTNPITSDKLKCQQPPYVASYFLCCSVISPAADMSQQHMAVCRTVWEGNDDRGTVTGDPGRCLSLSIDRARRPDDCYSHWRRQAGLAATSSFIPSAAERNRFENLTWHTVTERWRVKEWVSLIHTSFCYHTFKDTMLHCVNQHRQLKNTFHTVLMLHSMCPCFFSVEALCHSPLGCHSHTSVGKFTKIMAA